MNQELLVGSCVVLNIPSISYPRKGIVIGGVRTEENEQLVEVILESLEGYCDFAMFLAKELLEVVEILTTEQMLTCSVAYVRAAASSRGSVIEYTPCEQKESYVNRAKAVGQSFNSKALQSGTPTQLRV